MAGKIYFPGLNGLRFIAASAVIIHHIEQYKFWMGKANIWSHSWVDGLGHKAVSIFFVLSGFLITYLLLAEHEKTNDINVRNFYVRRILRIWPLYFFIILLAMVLLPLVTDISAFQTQLYDRYWLKLGLMLFFLPNLLRVFAPKLLAANQLWSVGIEEQFYILWPVLVKKFIHKIPQFLLGFIALKLAISLMLGAMVRADSKVLYEQLYNVWNLFQVEQMAIGAIGAWALYTGRKQIVDFICSRITMWVTLAIFIALFFLPYHHFILNYFEAVVFLIVIMNVTLSKHFPINFERPWLNTMGNISYGIYMYHTLCVAVVLLVLENFSLGNGWVFNVVLYLSSFALTYIISYYSYEYLEKPFLKFKERFMVIKSSTTAGA